MPSSPSPSSSAQSARQTLATRLREIRLGSGLSGKALSDAAGWHASKTSRIEHAVQPVTAEDVRTWCAVCGAEGETEDLVAALAFADGLYTQWRRLQPGGGLKGLQQSYVPLYGRTRRFRSYQGHVVPGLLQTVDYAEALLRKVGDYHGFRDDPRAAAAARSERSAILHSERRFTFVLEEAVLRYAVGGPAVMAGQLRYLLDVMPLSASSKTPAQCRAIPWTTDPRRDHCRLTRSPPHRELPMSATVHPALADFLPPTSPPASARAALFTGPVRYRVQTAAQSHESKKRSGSSDGAQTYDTPIT